jgi:cob(I)alamin adenosyltransferase
MTNPTSLDNELRGASGLVYVFTGEGKGKTSASLGVATRALLLDHQVAWIAFYKQESWGLAESKLRHKFANLEMSFGGKGFHMESKIARVGNKGHVVVDTASEDEHQASAAQCLVQAQRALTRKPFLLVLDEALNAVSDGLVGEDEVASIIAERGETHIILTGRGLTPGLSEMADLVTECVKIKHPYDVGTLAVPGLDF